MAKAAEKTIAFVKEWIEGKLTKRQYMHYYIVKTPYAQFLMKANEQPDLVAIKDSSGHIYLPENVLHSYSLKDEVSQRNPFMALLAEGFQFNYTLLEESSLNGSAGQELSKWKTLDHIQILNIDSDMNIHVSLVQIGDTRYITEMGFRVDDGLTVKDWANYEELKKRKFKDKQDKVQPYMMLRAVSGKPTKVMDVRGAYLEYVGDQVKTAIVTERWIFIPTEKKLLNEVADPNIHAILKTRPMAYHYGLTEDIINLEAAWKRTEYPFHPEQLNAYSRSNNFINIDNLPNGKAFLDAGHQWREWLLKHIEAEMAAGVIKFIDDDDAWLLENGYIMSAFAWGRTFKANLFGEPLNGYVLVVEESNPSICNKHVAYIKGNIFDNYNGKTTLSMPNFTKVIPAPHSNLTHNIEEFITYVCG